MAFLASHSAVRLAGSLSLGLGHSVDFALLGVFDVTGVATCGLAETASVVSAFSSAVSGECAQTGHASGKLAWPILISTRHAHLQSYLQDSQMD